MTTNSDSFLTESQASALFDILTHRETYAEIEAFKWPSAVQSYGPPFQSNEVHSTSPLLQTLVTRFFLPLPGVRDFGPTFWPERAKPLLEELAAANLSESFDKGSCGQRKTLATAVSALLEYVARGKLGGLPREDPQRSQDSYDVDNPEDLVAAFKDLLQGLVYGDLLEEVVNKIAETANLAEHTMLMQAAHRFMLINAASFLHYTLIVSPKGPALLGLLEDAHKLIPYTIMRQTLRVGNVATMINGMVKIVLAKASVGAVTNWLGLSSGWNEGMNLLQTIISTVLGWEARAFKKRALQIEKSNDGPSKDQLEKLREYTKKSKEEQAKYRAEVGKTSGSLAATIIGSSAPLQPTAQESAADYLALQLSIEDRDRITQVLCRHNPDLTTPLVRAVVSGYDPVIRIVHNAVDLPAGLTDAENFINDLIALAKPHSNSGDEDALKSRVPVSSFVKLFEKHQASCHRFLHQMAKNGGELTVWYREWLDKCAKQFRIPEDDPAPLKSLLEPLLGKLSTQDRESVIVEVDERVKYLSRISSSSEERARALVQATDKPSHRPDSESASKNDHPGPGVFLTKWQALLNDTEINTGSNGIEKVRDLHASDSHGVEKESFHAPRCDQTLALLLVPFRDRIRQVGEAEHWPTA